MHSPFISPYMIRIGSLYGDLFIALQLHLIAVNSVYIVLYVQRCDLRTMVIYLYINIVKAPAGIELATPGLRDQCSNP